MNLRLVDNPLVEFVIDSDGHELNVKEYNNLDPLKFAEYRLNAFEKGKPKILCAVCHTPVWPTLHVKRERFHFTHVKREDDQGCPYQEKRLSIDQINAKRYNGQKEGPDHKHLKRLLEISIRSDNQFDPEIRIEKNWYGADESKWRRPDLAATRNCEDGKSLKIAFEIQLSSTFLKVIAARREFYLEDNALLFWILKEAKEIDPRQYQNDLFYNNNLNLFIVDEETSKLSQKHGKLILRCRYLEPVLMETHVAENWKECLVSFDELVIDTNTHRAFYFNYETEKARLCKEAARIRQLEEMAGIREEYKEFANKLYKNENFIEGSYLKIRSALEYIDVSVPEKIPSDLMVFNRLVFSAQTGEPVMTGFKTLLEVANDGYVHGKRLMWYFGHVLRNYRTWNLLKDQDDKAAKRKKNIGKTHEGWDIKSRRIRAGYVKGGEFEPNRIYEGLFYFLFPELLKSK